MNAIEKDSASGKKPEEKPAIRGRYLRACEAMERAVAHADDPETVVAGLAGRVEMLRKKYVGEEGE